VDSAILLKAEGQMAKWVQQRMQQLGRISPTGHAALRLMTSANVLYRPS
jgi:hypothetical protein